MSNQARNGWEIGNMDSDTDKQRYDDDGVWIKHEESPK